MDNLHQEPKHKHFRHDSVNNMPHESEHEHFRHSPVEESDQQQFSKPSWFRRIKHRFLELFHDSRDKVADTQSTIKNYSNTAIQKIVDRPMPYLMMASALGFLLSSIIYRKKK